MNYSCLYLNIYKQIYVRLAFHIKKKKVSVLLYNTCILINISYLIFTNKCFNDKE